MSNPAMKPPTFRGSAPPPEPEKPAWVACRRLWALYGTPIPAPAWERPGMARWFREHDLLRALATVLTECRDGAAIFDAATALLERGEIGVPFSQAEAPTGDAFELEGDAEIPAGPSPEHLADRMLVDTLDARMKLGKPTKWERDFAGSLREKVFDQGHRLSERQLTKVAELFLKYPEEGSDG